jgi:glycosyltransferase involved in cell wall biosynthesis
MRIGIDAHIIGKQRGGVETVLDNVIRTLARLDHENQYFIYVTKRCPWRTEEWPSNFHLRLLPSESPWLERLIVLPLYYWQDRLDVVHVQRALPFWGCSHSVLHIHDVLYVTHPHLFSPWRRMILNPVFRRSSHRATRIVTPSATARDDIMRSYGIDYDKIVIIPNGVDQTRYYRLLDQNKIASTAHRFGIRQPYVIFLGAIERNKNVLGLLEAYAKFRVTCPDFQLVVAGKLRAETKKGYEAEVRDRVAQLGLQTCVKFTGYLSAEDYRSMLSGAHMMAFPSLAEGFGLPPLEAMACGVPVVTSDLAVFRELYGDAVLSADAHDIDQLASVMVRLASEEGLAEIMRQKGLKKANSYKWEFACRRLMDVYRSAASSKNSS